MRQESWTKTGQHSSLVAVLAVFALLAGLYFSLRFSGMLMEVDASIHTS